MSEIREAGWYWVKNSDLTDGWIAAHWFCCDYEGWMWAACGEGFEDEQCQEIGPRIPSPDESWQTVPVEMTEKMADAFNEQQTLGYNPANEAEYRPRHTWRRMLSAAPKPGGK